MAKQSQQQTRSSQWITAMGGCVIERVQARQIQSRSHHRYVALAQPLGVLCKASSDLAYCGCARRNFWRVIACQTPK